MKFPVEMGKNCSHDAMIVEKEIVSLCNFQLNRNIYYVPFCDFDSVMKELRFLHGIPLFSQTRLYFIFLSVSIR